MAVAATMAVAVTVAVDLLVAVVAAVDWFDDPSHR